MKPNKSYLPVYNKCTRFILDYPLDIANDPRRQCLATVLTAPEKGQAYLIKSVDAFVQYADFSIPQTTNCAVIVFHNIFFLASPSRTNNNITGAFLELFSDRMQLVGSAMAIQDGQRDILQSFHGFKEKVFDTISGVQMVSNNGEYSHQANFVEPMVTMDLGIFVGFNFSETSNITTQLNSAVVTCNVKYSKININQDMRNKLELLYGSTTRPEIAGDDTKYDQGGPVNV